MTPSLQPQACLLNYLGSNANINLLTIKYDIDSLENLPLGHQIQRISNEALHGPVGRVRETPTNIPETGRSTY